MHVQKYGRRHNSEEAEKEQPEVERETETETAEIFSRFYLDAVL